MRSISIKLSNPKDGLVIFDKSFSVVAEWKPKFDFKTTSDPDVIEDVVESLIEDNKTFLREPLTNKPISVGSLSLLFNLYLSSSRMGAELDMEVKVF